MQDKHKHMWWCMDTALQEMRAQFVESTNHCVIDDFLGPDAFAKVLADVIQAKSEGMLDVDGLLSFKGREETIRTDRLGWFDCSETPTGAGGVECHFTQSQGDGTGDEAKSGPASAYVDPAQSKSGPKWTHLQYLLQRIETLVSELGDVDTATSSSAENRAANSEIGDMLASCKTRSKVMVTCYDGKEDDSSKYTRHVDNGNRNGRRVTAIYYLNEGWKQSHGGVLRLYANADASEKSESRGLLAPHKVSGRTGSAHDIDSQSGGEEMAIGVDNTSIHCAVEPKADRLVLFLADWRTPHEVLPTHKDRLAVTVWFYDPVEKHASNAAAAAAAAAAATTTTAAATAATAATAAPAEAVLHTQEGVSETTDEASKREGLGPVHAVEHAVSIDVSPSTGTVFTDQDELD